jgi:hypothetical protein
MGRAIRGYSCESAAKQLRLGLLNSFTADWRECSRMTSKNIDGMVVCDELSRCAGRSADICVDRR